VLLKHAISKPNGKFFSWKQVEIKNRDAELLNHKNLQKIFVEGGAANSKIVGPSSWTNTNSNKVRHIVRLPVKCGSADLITRKMRMVTADFFCGSNG